MKILIIEDDSKIISVLGLSFQIVWTTVEIVSAGWGQEGIELVERESPDVIILDIGLPDMDGLDVIKQIRLFSQIPILVLTVDTNESTVVQALELGANEYVTKPFRQMELIARVKKLLKRQKNIENGEKYSWGSLKFDYSQNEIIYNNKVISLTCTESKILHSLISSSPNVVSYNTLSHVVWGDCYDGSINSLRVHIRRIRKKIETNPNKPVILMSKASRGYYAVKPEK